MFLKYHGRHIIAICGSYLPLNEKGEQAGVPTFYSCTRTIFEILGSWCIVTAGHVLRNLEAASKCPRVRTEFQVLADYCGVGATNDHPIPFKPLEEGWTFIVDDDLGLDFGLVFIQPFYREILKSNGILPLTSRQWNFPPDLAFETRGIVGFPDEYTEGHPISGGRTMVGRVEPTFVPIRRLPDDTSKKFTRYKGEIIDRGNQQSIKGMSGGPIFGFFQEDGEKKYLLEALQVEWNEVSIVYGCPIKTIMAVLRAKLEEHRRSQSHLPEPS